MLSQIPKMAHVKIRIQNLHKAVVTLFSCEGNSLSQFSLHWFTEVIHWLQYTPRDAQAGEAQALLSQKIIFRNAAERLNLI